MGAKVQHRVGVEVFFQVTVESRKRMGGRKAFFKQQTHGVTFVAEGGLYCHQQVAVLVPHDEDGLAVGQLLAGRRAPLRFNLRQPFFAANVLLGGNQGVHIGVSAILLGVAVQNAIAQRIHALGQVHAVALGLHLHHGVEQRLEHRQISGSAGVARVGREVKDDHGHLALGSLGAAQIDQFAHPR